MGGVKRLLEDMEELLLEKLTDHQAIIDWLQEFCENFFKFFELDMLAEAVSQISFVKYFEKTF